MKNNQIVSFTEVNGENKYRIQGNLHLCNNGISLTIFGGERPHVGTVVLAVPEKDGAYVSVINLPGHREEVVARKAAVRIAEKLEIPAVVTAGIHIDGASESEIKILVENTDKLVDLFLNKIAEYMGGHR